MFFFDGIICIKIMSHKNMKVDTKSYKNIFIYYIGYVPLNNIKTLYIIFNGIIRYIKENNRNNNFRLIHYDKNKDLLKKQEDVKLNRIHHQVKSNNLSDYDEKYMKIKFSSVDCVSLRTTLEMHDVGVLIRQSFRNDNKYNPQWYLYECLQKLAKQI